MPRIDEKRRTITDVEVGDAIVACPVCGCIYVPEKLDLNWQVVGMKIEMTYVDDASGITVVREGRLCNCYCKPRGKK